jgi:hypothetical protein
MFGSRSRGTSLRAVLYDIGLRDGLTLCLDAADNRSYPGSGTQLLDLSGGGYDFDFGAAGAAPTFTGTANQRDAYLAFDGGDYLTYEAANASWMNAQHQSGALVSWAFLFYHATAEGSLMGTNGGTTGNTGINITYNASEAVACRVRNAGAQVMASYVSTALLTENAWNFVSISINAAAGASGGHARINGTAETFNATYASPAAGASTHTLQLMARGNNNTPAPAGERLRRTAAWSGRALTAAEQTRMFTALRGNLGI